MNPIPVPPAAKTGRGRALVPLRRLGLSDRSGALVGRRMTAPAKGRTDELREAQRRALLSAPASPENDAAQDAWEAAWTPESTDQHPHSCRCDICQHDAMTEQDMQR